jgi:phage anti-repressor protein
LQLKTIANEILPIYETEEGYRVVNARDLHEQLVSKQEFSNWIKRRISNYGFTENEDYFSFDKIIKREKGASVRKEYILTIDTAKEIAMVENNEQGRAIRKYFIEVEKRFRAKRPTTMLEVLQSAIDQMILQEKQIQQIKKENQTLKYRIENLDQIDTIGDLQQRLNKMVKRYAWNNGLNMGTAWKHFDQAFNTAFRTNLNQRKNNYVRKHGLKGLTRPQYLSVTNQLEDAIRVADKMLNQHQMISV